MSYPEWVIFYHKFAALDPQLCRDKHSRWEYQFEEHFKFVVLQQFDPETFTLHFKTKSDELWFILKYM